MFAHRSPAVKQPYVLYKVQLIWQQLVVDDFFLSILTI